MNKEQRRYLNACLDTILEEKCKKIGTEYAGCASLERLRHTAILSGEAKLKSLAEIQAAFATSSFIPIVSLFNFPDFSDADYSKRDKRKETLRAELRTLRDKVMLCNDASELLKLVHDFSEKEF